MFVERDWKNQPRNQYALQQQQPPAFASKQGAQHHLHGFQQQQLGPPGRRAQYLLQEIMQHHSDRNHVQFMGASNV
jgi:lysine/ornithine N-monooxygenase